LGGMGVEEEGRGRGVVDLGIIRFFVKNKI
jgi:hypothetical protein